MRREAREYVVGAAQPAHYLWLKDRTSCELTDGFRAIEALGLPRAECAYCGRDHGTIAGMVGFSGWTPASVSMHLALDRRSCIPLLRRAAFDYAFRQAGRQLVVGVTPGDNEAALRLNRALGFREAARLRDGWSAGVDVVVQEMRRDECRWLED